MILFYFFEVTVQLSDRVGCRVKEAFLFFRFNLFSLGYMEWYDAVGWGWIFFFSSRN